MLSVRLAVQVLLYLVLKYDSPTSDNYLTGNANEVDVASFGIWIGNRKPILGGISILNDSIMF